MSKLTTGEQNKLSEEALRQSKAVDEEFRTQFSDYLKEQLQNNNIRICDLRGFYFPSMDLNHTTFPKEADLTQTRFAGPIDFSFSRFKEAARFNHVRFQEGADFVGTWFEGVADFTFSRFHGDVNFVEAAFQAEARFLHMEFEDRAFFSGSKFEHFANFRSAKFGGGVLFRGAEFLNRAQFTGGRDHRCFLDEVELTDIRFGKDSDVVFLRTNLERASFVDTDVERILFRDVTWYQPRHGWVLSARPCALWDEFQPLEHVGWLRNASGADRDHEKIAENYRQLVLNYERHRDYDTAESFHIGEMEMRRKKKAAYVKNPAVRKLREWLNAYGAYRALSNYGTSYAQALLVLMAIIAVFSLAFLYAGFRTTDDNNNRVIEYNVFSDSSHRRVSANEWADDFISAVSLCASIVTFQKDRFYEPLPGISRLWLFLGFIAFTGQGAMTLLALRRRFRR